MGSLLKTFTYPRNAFGKSTEASAQKAIAVLQRVETNALLRDTGAKIKDEPFNDFRNLHAIVGGQPGDARITPVGQMFREFCETSPSAAWRWLLTRSLWLYSVPNGTQSHVNERARELGVSFNFFDMVTRLVVHMSALPKPHNVVYFDELLAVLDSDENWSLDSEDLHDRVLEKRRELGVADPAARAPLLAPATGNLEGRFEIGRDNMNTVFKKAFGQTGLFELAVARPSESGGETYNGIFLHPGAYVDRVLAERLRFVLDHPRRFTG